MNKNVARKISGRRWAIVIAVRLAMGIVWDLLAAAVLFHGYSFFESIVVCLLVMILCALATVSVELDIRFSSFSVIFKGLEDAKDSDTAKGGEPDAVDQVQGVLKVLFYGIAFAMALVKLVMTLVG